MSSNLHSGNAYLFPVPPLPGCHASIVVPARNEESCLGHTLEALRRQVDLFGEPLDTDSYEVLLLLNNCTDGSAAVVERFRLRFPEMRLHLAEVTLDPDRAHVGTARRLLMDAACERMEGQAVHPCAILSTDADTLVAPDWVAANLAEVLDGAEVVGGVINLLPEDLDSLDAGTLRAYQRDRRYQALVAQLESLLDPDPADPWPRHLEHFGASLACTCEAYRRSGGVPPVKPLEDVAFIDALRKVGARLRHSPRVHIHTSARLHGRAEVGLSGQLRIWQQESQVGTPHIVESAEWLAHRFRSLAALRRLNAHTEPGSLRDYPAGWQPRLRAALAERLPDPRFFEVLDCNLLIEQMFTGEHRHAEITRVLRELERLTSRPVRQPKRAPAHPAESVDAVHAQLVAIPGD